MDRARAAMIAHSLLQIGATTPQSIQALHSRRPALDRCHNCYTSVPIRWCVHDGHGPTAVRIIDTYADAHITNNKCRSPPFDKIRDSVPSDLLDETRLLFRLRAHQQGIMLCWVCTVAVIRDVIHTTPHTPEHTPQHQHQLTRTRYSRQHSSTSAPSLPIFGPTISTPFYIATLVRRILHHKFGRTHTSRPITQHHAPFVQPHRAPFGHGLSVGVIFPLPETTPPREAIVYMVAPDDRFLEPGRTSLYPITQLRAYYRTIPSMAHPDIDHGSTPFQQFLDISNSGEPHQPSAPPPLPPTPQALALRVIHNPDTDLHSLYYQISHILTNAQRNSIDGYLTARNILARGHTPASGVLYLCTK